jgi:hypothetical protein
MPTTNFMCGFCNMTLRHILIQGLNVDREDWRFLVAERSDDFNRIIKEANTRAKYHTKTDFPDTIKKFARKVEAWFQQYDQIITLQRFKGQFITMGEAKLGFAGYITKIVPIIHTDAEFEALLSGMGYEFEDADDDSMAITVLVCGDREWDDRKLLVSTLRQLPTGSTIVECGADEGIEVLAAQLGESLGFTIDEYPCRKLADFEEVFNEEIDGLLVFHTDPKSSKRVMAIARLAKDNDIPIKVVKKSVDLTDWIDDMFEEA